MHNQFLISTKLAPPRHAVNQVLRHRLLDRLIEGQHHKLVTISAPAGYGKTTLLTQWRKQLISDGYAVSWLLLNEEDNVPNLLLAYVIEALSSEFSELKDLSGTWEDEQSALNNALNELVNALANSSKTIYLILDDFHSVTNNGAVELIERLIKYSPPNVHIALSGRSQPHIALSQLRVADDLTEIDSDQLRFTFAETRSFLKRRLRQDISLNSARLLYDLSEGWPAMLQLMAIRFQGSDELDTAIETIPTQLNDLSVYLIEEVMQSVSTELRDFIVQISICRRFNVELCRAITGMEHSSELLRQLEEKNLFTMPIDMKGQYQWYRFHQLFSQLVGQMPQQDKALESKLHKRASVWFEQEELLTEAMQHALAARDYERAVKLLDRCSEELLERGQYTMVLSWIDRLPARALRENVQAAILKCTIGAQCFRVQEAEELLLHIEAHAAQNRQDSDLQYKVQLLKATLAIVTEDSETAWRHISDMVGAQLFTEKYYNRGLSNIASFCLLYRREYAQLRWVQDQCRDMPSPDSPLTDYLGDCLTGYSWQLQGEFAQAESTYRSCLSHAEKHRGRLSEVACMAASLLASLLYLRGEVDASRELLANRIEVITSWSIPEFILVALLTDSRLAFLDQNSIHARQSLDRLEQIAHKRGFPRLLAHCYAERLRQLLIVDQPYPKPHYEEFDRLHALAQEHGQVSGPLEDIQWAYEISKLRLSSLQTSFSRKNDELPGLLQQYDKERYPQRHILLLLHLSNTQTGAKSDAPLEQARNLIQQMCMQSVLQDEMPFLTDIRCGSQTGVFSTPEPQEVTPIVSDEMPATQAAAQTSHSADPKLMEQWDLSDREVEILHMLGNSLPNKKIALALGISPNTVKYHLKNVFLKLEVTKRDEAVAQARRVGLISQ